MRCLPFGCILLLVAVAVAAAPAHAQDTTLTRHLLANRHAISIESGLLSGAGGRRLVEMTKPAQFVLLGEEHGVAEIPVAVGALLRELRPAGFGTLAIEVSPLRGRELDQTARRAVNGAQVAAALDSSLSSWRTAVPFYALGEEREMLREAMTPLGKLPAMRVWGLDYEVSADRQYLGELETLVAAPGRAAVRAARALADEGFARLTRTGDPSRLFAFSAPDSILESLRAALGKRPAPRATDIVDLLTRTVRINRHFLAGRTYESNLDRSRFIRENFAHEWQRASSGGQAPKVVFKFGGSHMMRGYNYTHTLDVGTATAMLAESRGWESVNVLMLGGAGSRSSRMNIAKAQYESGTPAEVDGRMLAWLKPALPDSGWAMFDLRAARAAFLRSERTSLTPQQDRFLHAYDAVIVFGGSHPGALRSLAPQH